MIPADRIMPSGNRTDINSGTEQHHLCRRPIERPQQRIGFAEAVMLEAVIRRRPVGRRGRGKHGGGQLEAAFPFLGKRRSRAGECQGNDKNSQVEVEHAGRIIDANQAQR